VGLNVYREGYMGVVKKIDLTPWALRDGDVGRGDDWLVRELTGVGMGNTRRLPEITMTPEVIDAINGELAYQSTIGIEVGRPNATDHGVAGQLVVLDVYTKEAMLAWAKSPGDEPALAAMRKVAAIAIRALIQYGCPRR
jgi:hypothetical protein